MATKRNMLLIIIIIFFIGCLLAYKAINGFYPIPIGFRHLINLTLAPSDLYKPIVLDNYQFWEKGFSKKYYMNPIYFDIYEIGFYVGNGGIESTYKFHGKIKVEFYCKENLIYNSTITKMDHAWYKQNNLTHYKQISLFKFDIPLKNKYTKDLSVNITVIDPDKELKKFCDSINLYIAVSASP